MSNNNEVILKVENLCQYFKIGDKELKAVDNVSFEIHKGEVFGLVGESGCGKTTTGRSIIKLYDITSGNVYFKGQRIAAGTRSYTDAIKEKRTEANSKIKEFNNEIKNDPNKKLELEEKIKAIKEDLNNFVATQNELIKSAKHDHKNCDKGYSNREIKVLEEEYLPKLQGLDSSSEEYKTLKKEFNDKKRILKNTKLVTNIQMIFQDPIASLNPRMTVQEIISEGLIIKGVKDKEYIKKQVYDILETVGLVKEHATRYPHEFSGGQRQRIGIARSIIMNPDIIIADEPISALDVSIQAQVINLLNELREKLGLTILFIAHDLSVVKYFSDRIGVMYFGKMVELADADELFANPMHPYTKSLLSAIPLPDPNYEKKRQRITYNPLVEHNYENSKPSFREVRPNHFVLCNDEEEQKLKETYGNN